jgi:NAD(P)H-dependent FMN reductase
MKTRNCLAFGASYSRNSINAQFAAFVAHSIPNSLSKVVDLTGFDIPLFTPQQEEEKGIPKAVKVFDQLIQEADILVISMAEHNGSYTAAFKNLFRRKEVDFNSYSSRTSRRYGRIASSRGTFS